MQPSRRPVRLVLALSLALAAGVGLPGRAAEPALKETGRAKLSARLLELTMTTTALPKPTKVRVLLPAGYASGTKRYPVLYLLNGGGGSYLDWTTQGNAEKLTATLPAIVVMPDGGTGGNYTDWYGQDGTGFVPRWETYHLRQLLPWVDAHFRTLARRDQRVIAGLSMGGNGALHYAARHPDLFVGAASFSGANDVFQPLIRPITETTGISEGAPPGAVFGPSATQELRWRAFNPVDLAPNLRDLWVSLAFGNGQPGGPDGSTGVDPIEQAVYDGNVALHKRLVAAGIPHGYNSYGPGAHNWWYWQRDLRQALPAIARLWAEQRPWRGTLSHWSAAKTWSVFGWTVRITRPVDETSRIIGATCRAFSLRGTGTATVTTPACFTAGRVITVRTADAKGTRTHTARVGSDRRVTVPVDLGASNPYQQHTAASALTGTVIREARVVFS